MPRYYPTISQRFWSKVDQSAGTDECWPWTAGKFGTGYGAFSINGHVVGAHRIAYSLTKPGLTDTDFICHRCDNPPCCNPTHLFPGTPADNMLDRDNKLRQAHGERQWKAKLTSRDVLAIRALLLRASWIGIYTQTAKAFGVDESTIHNIEDRLSWKHLP